MKNLLAASVCVIVLSINLGLAIFSATVEERDALGRAQPLQMRYWNGSALADMDHMGISKDGANSIGQQILKQTSQKNTSRWVNQRQDEPVSIDKRKDEQLHASR